MNNSTVDCNKKNLGRTAIAVAALIILVQFIDSYCTEIFGRTQSLSVTTFLIDAREMSADEGVAYMSRMMLPFYLIGMLTPFVRSYADIVGRKVMLFINVALLAVGSVICMLADSLIIYLLGNGILILGYSLDIHMIYIVDMLPANRRATVRGICGGTAMAAAMCIPLMRSLVANRSGHGWQEIYVVGIAGGVVILACMGIYMVVRSAAGQGSCGGDEIQENETATNETFIKRESVKDGNIHFIQTLGALCKQNRTKALLISICAVGLATAGIQYYNEPLLAFGGMIEKNVNLVLVWQPMTALAVNVITGIAADRTRREYVVAAGITLSLVSGCVFIIGAGHIASPVLMGILWGSMSGSYYSSEELINMMVMESAAPEVRGRASAMSTFAYGIGDQLGIFTISIVVGIAGMRWTKLMFLGIPLVAAMIVINRHLKIRSDRQA
ncbi:MFS transporter [Coprococcus sp. AM14-16]|jgi:predicted MFS family arabinose efflux permease|uniref:MFS transporter n=1 Tax=Coprococcus TaxID=33042 RepID=UPI000E402599|nr:MULTISPECIES: MFS transporter [Coprococcus]RGD41416.1 MFS transporter [Coprococcus sp. AM14-16]